MIADTHHGAGVCDTTLLPRTKAAGNQSKTTGLVLAFCVVFGVVLVVAEHHDGAS